MLAKLQKFQKKISATPVASETESKVEGDEDDDIVSLRGVQLNFAPETGKVSLKLLLPLPYNFFHLFEA